MSDKRVLFVLKYRENQEKDWGDTPDPKTKLLHSGLFNSANFMNEMLQKNNINSTLKSVLDNNFIHREIVQFKATHVIVEGFWVVPSKFDELKAACPNVKFIIRNHSESPFLASEGIGFKWILEYLTKPNVQISANAPRMLNETRFLASQLYSAWTDKQIKAAVPYLPNYYPIQEQPQIVLDKNKDTLDIGCFGAIRPLKNHMEQAIGAIMFAAAEKKKLRFHINAGRIEMNGSPVLHNLQGLFSKFPGQYDLVEHPWRHHTDFKHLIGTMDLVTQVSFSETFNIVGADAVSMGIPVIGSSEIPWLNESYHAIPTDSEHIAHIMQIAYNMKVAEPEFNPNLAGLRESNQRNEKIWTNYFAN